MKYFRSLIVICALASGCASENDYQKAFSEQTALSGNSRTYSAPAAVTLRTVKQVLVRQGFTIDHADISTGTIKGVRNMKDRSEDDLSYNITASADVSDSLGDGSVLTFAASQQTVLHRKEHTWWHLLWLIPLFPTGTEYQTVVTKEGDVTDDKFYSDFFAAVEKGLLTAPGAFH